ncbi:MAG: FAD-dependent oxidoreductase [Bacillota bacterium]|nr:FAD-dependent oxidoreductase [Bacillota bacterium]
MNYVIIGNSAAAVGCVEGIRSVDKKGGITIISDEPHHTYSRPLISYYLCGKTTPEKMLYRDADFYEKNGCTCMLGKKVVKIDAKDKKVVLDDGKAVSYDKLLVATGSRPFVPPMTGLDTVKDKFTFMSYDDALALEKAVSQDSRVLIIGAGLIGLKCAEGLYGRVKNITVIDLADKVLSSILNSDGSARMKAHLESKGLVIKLSDSVDHFDGNTAYTKNGDTIPFDVLVVAVGVRPNTELLAQAGGKVGRGILTDHTQKTNLDDVYAAGDCCESDDITKNQSRILALLPNAYMQGETAGVNMADGEKSFDNAMPMNAIGFFGLHILTAGSYDGEEHINQDEESYKDLFVSDGLLKGFIIIGDIQRAGIYTSLIREKVPLESVDTTLLFKAPQLMMFGRVERKAKLGVKNND